MKDCAGGDDIARVWRGGARPDQNPQACWYFFHPGSVNFNPVEGQTIPFSEGSTRMTLPDRRTGPIRRSSMGAETAALRNCAAPNPAAAIITTSSPKKTIPRRFLRPMTPITGDQENSAPQPNFRFRREDEISPDPGGEQDRRPQCDPSVILARRYAGFTSPARRQA